MEMTKLNILIGISTIISNVFLSVGVVIAVFQLVQMRKGNILQFNSTKADHDRRRKQSTIEFYNEIYPYLKDCKAEIVNAFGEGYVTPDDQRYQENPSLQKAITEYLTVIERFAVGINAGIYDINVFARTSGKVVSDTYKRLSPVIENMRKVQNYPQLFNDFEKMCKEVDKVREKMYPKLQGENLISVEPFDFIQ